MFGVLEWQLGNVAKLEKDLVDSEEISKML